MAESSTAGLTPAQKLMEKHAADEAHRPTVEDTVDEEDVAHPVPSASASSTRPESAASNQPVSDKAAGKQKAQDGPKALNMHSEEMFPALGAPKARAPVTAPSWSARTAASSANGVNGSHNGVPASSHTSSRASTPASAAAGARGPALPGVSLPGRHIDHFDMAPHQMTPRNQLKKPVRDVLNDINRRSKAKVSMREVGGNVRFEAQGPTGADVQMALKEVASQVGAKQSVKVPIPASLRPHIIGRQGATVNSIKKDTGANIQLPKQDGSAPVAEDDEDSMIDVTLEGDAIAVALARRHIERIVGERTSTVNYRLKDIPSEFYPFLAGVGKGQDDVQVQIPNYYTWTTRPPPRPSKPGQPAAFEPQGNHSIAISGERKAAQDLREALERQVEQLRRQLTVLPMSVERGRHQFIVGDRGVAHSDFLNKTGCVVILPPEVADDEFIYIIGPPDRVEKGKAEAWELARQMAMTFVDVARQHRNAPMGSQAHSWALTQYLKQRQAIANLEKEHGASIVLPPSLGSSSSWEIYTKDDKASQAARSDIIDMISSHPPARVASMNVDPFYFQHLRQKVSSQVRDDHGVYVVIPNEADETPQLHLVYEDAGPSAKYQVPRGPPSQADSAKFKEGLLKAQKHIDDLIARQQEITAQDVETPTKFHDKIRRYVDRQQQDLKGDQVPVQVLIGSQRPQEARSRSSNGLLMRGPGNSVQSLHQKILEFIQQEEKDELERGYTTSCDFPQEYIKNLIGTQGSNINKLREEFDCEIQAQDGKVEIKGPKAKADSARAHILALAKKLKDERTHELTVPQKYHRDLIGAKGSQVNRLQDRYHVRINFPRSNAAADDDAEGTENGHRGRSQAPDKVIIKGPSSGADEAKREIENLLKYIMETSHTATVSVAQNQIPSLIGAGGREMEKLRLDTGAQIEVPSAQAGADPSGRVEITLKGTKAQVEEAKKQLQHRAKAFDETVSRSVEVDKKHHKALIGSGGNNIRDIVVKAGGPDDRREITRMVRFPPQGSEEGAIRVEGNQAVVDKIVAAIESFVGTKDSQVTETIDVAPSKHRLLIGHNGEKRRSLESQFTITLDIPRQNTPGPAGQQVKISGQPAEVAKAKEHILDLVKDQGGETIQVPRHLHHSITDNGSFFRSLRNEHKVKVDHGGKQPPPRPAAAPARPKVSGGNLPLITDDPTSSDLSFSWDLVEPAQIPESSETIPWILQGQPAAVAKAKELIEAKLQNASQGGLWTGYLGLPDPRSYGLIVGPGGSRINSLRKQSSTQINVPKAGTKDEAVEITGSKEGCEKAKDLILELIKSQGQGRRGSTS